MAAGKSSLTSRQKKIRTAKATSIGLVIVSAPAVIVFSVYFIITLVAHNVHWDWALIGSQLLLGAVIGATIMGFLALCYTLGSDYLDYMAKKKHPQDA